VSDLEPLTPEQALQEITRLQALLEGKSSYVDCICPGCPRKIPEAWAAGMCETCAAEDCEHTDGAKATSERLNEAEAELEQVAAEGDQARADLAKAVEEREALRANLRLACDANDRLRAEVLTLRDQNERAWAERDRRASAVLNPTRDEVIDIAVSAGCGRLTSDEAMAFVAALRARAGEPTPATAPRRLQGLWVHCQRPGCDASRRVAMNFLEKVERECGSAEVIGMVHTIMLQLPDGWTVGMDPQGTFYAVCPGDTEATRAETT